MGKGAFTPAGFPGRKAMSKSHMPQGKNHTTGGATNRSKVYTPDGFPGYACPNPAHGLTRNSSPTKGMINAEGRLGASKKGFSSGGIAQGPNPIGKKK